MATIYGTSIGQTLKGTVFADYLYGRAGDDFLYGYGGDDLLDGGTGIDVMRGGTGSDTYRVDNESDRALESVGEGTDTVIVSNGYYALWAGSSIERLTTSFTGGAGLIGNEFANRIEGNIGNDYLKGGAGADTILGFGGDDILFGNAGVDRLTGGAGRDIFVFTDEDHSRDTITDFVSGTDKIDLGWWAHEMGGATFHFIGGAAFDHHAAEGRYANGQFQLDANGDGIADLTILMAQVHASDIVIAAYGYWDY